MDVRVKSNWLKQIALGVLLLGIVLAGLYFPKKTETFAVLQQHIHNDANLKQRIGEITEVNLLKTRIVSDSSEQPGYAWYSVKINGSKDSVSYKYRVTKHGALWDVQIEP